MPHSRRSISAPNGAVEEDGHLVIHRMDVQAVGAGAISQISFFHSPGYVVGGGRQLRFGSVYAVNAGQLQSYIPHRRRVSPQAVGQGVEERLQSWVVRRQRKHSACSNSERVSIEMIASRRTR